MFPCSQMCTIGRSLHWSLLRCQNRRHSELRRTTIFRQKDNLLRVAVPPVLSSSAPLAWPLFLWISLSLGTDVLTIPLMPTSAHSPVLRPRQFWRLSPLCPCLSWPRSSCCYMNVSSTSAQLFQGCGSGYRVLRRSQNLPNSKENLSVLRTVLLYVLHFTFVLWNPFVVYRSGEIRKRPNFLELNQG